MAPNNLIGALEELAKKRTEITSAIVTLASVCGVDARLYLVDQALETHVTGPPFVPVFHLPTQEPPPRPQQPASPTTKGTGRAHTVSSSRADAILAALARHGAMSPGELAKAMDLTVSGVSYHVTKLIEQKQVKATGTSSDRRISLA
jgi:hypothetical protein